MSLPHNVNPDQDLVFLKFGGSLITDKSQPRTARDVMIARLAREVSAAREENPDLKIVLGHGSGSFGHISGRKYGTRKGVASPEEWHGFSEVWFDAAQLNHHLMEALHQAHLPAISLPPSASALLAGRQVSQWQLEPLQRALDHHLLPVVYGDIVFDDQIGGTILSTEEVFSFLARELYPGKILLAGLEPGVWEDYPQCTRVVPEITPTTFPKLTEALRESGTPDVTGGMAGKVKEMLSLVEDMTHLEIWIFSGLEEGNVLSALCGKVQGTQIHH